MIYNVQPAGIEINAAESARDLRRTCHSGGFRIGIEFRFVLVTSFAVALYCIAASINSGWIFLLSAALMLVGFCAVVVPWLSLRQLKVTSSAPESVTAGDDLSVMVSIWPEGVLLPACDLIVRVRDASDPRSDRVSENAVIDDARELPGVAVVLPAVRRGVVPIPDVEVETAYPFGLAWLTRVYRSGGSVFVLPKVYPLEGRFLYQIKSSQYVPGSGRLVSSSGFQSSASRGVREYQRSDSRRFINWALSARHNKLMVKEFDREGLAVFDLAIAAFAFWESDEQLELAVSTCASLAKFGHDQGVHPQLHILMRSISGAGLPEHTLDLEQQLRALASVQRPADGGAKDWYAGLEYLSGRSRALVLIVPDSGKLSGSLDFIPAGVILVSIKTFASTFGAGVDNVRGLTSLVSVAHIDDFAEL